MKEDGSMMMGGKFEFTVKFDNIYETDGFIRREFSGFQKSVTLVFEFVNLNEDIINVLSSQFPNSHWDKNKFTITIDNINERFFLDETYELIERIENEFNGVVTEISVTVSKETDMNNMDNFIKDIYRGLEHWNFTRIMDCIERVKV
jgi:hypothetical protein